MELDVLIHSSPSPSLLPPLSPSIGHSMQMLFTSSFSLLPPVSSSLLLFDAISDYIVITDVLGVCS